MSEQHVKAGEVDEAKKVLDVVLPSGDEAAEAVHPCEQPLHFPASAIPAQLTAILSSAPIAPVGRDHLDAIFFLEPAVERV